MRLSKFISSIVSKKSTDDLKSKDTKTFFTGKNIFTLVIVIAIVIVILYGNMDPSVSIVDDQVQIKGMYGLNIDISDISDIKLIEKSMKEIGIGRRTNGYGGIGNSLKGHFESDTLGETLLLVQANSAPTIKIERLGKKDIYISLRNSESTEQLYSELISILK